MKEGQQHSYSPAIASLGWPIIGIVGGLTIVTGLIGAASIPIWGTVTLFGWLSLNGPVGRAIADRINAETDAELPIPEEVYAELDDLRTRMLEMEERQEFAERLIGSDDVGGPKGGSDGK